MIGWRPKDCASWHACTNGGTHWDTGRVNAVEAEDIDAKIIRRHALAVKWVDSAGLAEVVRGRKGVELVGAQGFLAGKQAKRALMDFDHQRILSTANGAIAGSQLWKVRDDLKANRSAVATASECFVWLTGHEWY